MLKRDTVDSFSRLMSEIEDLERKQGSDYENEYKSPPKEGDRSSSGGHSSVDSLMDDTPSNYNTMN